MKNQNKPVFILCEGGIMLALALALSFLKIQLGPQGGSIDFVMVPLIIFALRRGPIWGCGLAFLFGTVKYFIAAGFAISWVSFLLDYSVAYATVGLAGCFKWWNKPAGHVVGTIVGCLARFAVHFVSGITVYAMYMPDEFLSLTMTSPWLYSLLYNGIYMGPNTVVAVILVPLLMLALKKAHLDIPPRNAKQVEDAVKAS